MTIRRLLWQVGCVRQFCRFRFKIRLNGRLTHKFDFASKTSNAIPLSAGLMTLEASLNSLYLIGVIDSPSISSSFLFFTTNKYSLELV